MSVLVLCASMPPDRIVECKPFSVTRVDFTVPLYVEEAISACSKAYILLRMGTFARAVHLELVKSLSMQVFLLAFCHLVE